MSRITNVTVFHGYGVTTRSMWFPHIHRVLEAHGLAVTVPELPKPFHPDFRTWLRAAMPIARRWTPQTLVIAHSLGSVLALRLLERVAKHPVAATILVAPPFAASVNVRSLVDFYRQPIDWHRVHDMSRSFHVIHSKDDPLVPPDHSARYAEALGASVTYTNTGGHFTAKTCPPLERELKKLLG